MEYRMKMKAFMVVTLVHVVAGGLIRKHSFSADPKKPISYASFIITPPERGRSPMVLVEEQDRFEFPDKKIRFRVFGPEFPPLRTDVSSSNESNQVDGEVSFETSGLIDYDNESEINDGNGSLDKLGFVKVTSLDNMPDFTDILDDDFEIEMLQDRFAGASSVFWFEQDQAIYVTDALASKVHRYEVVINEPSSEGDQNIAENLEDIASPEKTSITFGQPLDLATQLIVNPSPFVTDVGDDPAARSSKPRRAVLRESILNVQKSAPGLLGPAIPVSFSKSSSKVNVSLGINTNFVHNTSWDLSQNFQEVRIDDELGQFEPFQRYHRFSFGKKDPLGRLVTASRDIRQEMEPYPCQDVLILENPLNGSTKMCPFENAKNNGIVCRPAGVDFSSDVDSGTFMVYIDEVTRNLIQFSYDIENGEMGSYEILARHSGDPEQSSRPTAIVSDPMTNLIWVGFSGDAGKLMGINVHEMSVSKTIRIPDNEVVDLTFDHTTGSIWVLSRNSLFRMKRRSLSTGK